MSALVNVCLRASDCLEGGTAVLFLPYFLPLMVSRSRLVGLMDKVGGCCRDLCAWRRFVFGFWQSVCLGSSQHTTKRSQLNRITLKITLPLKLWSENPQREFGKWNFPVVGISLAVYSCKILDLLKYLRTLII